MTRRRQISADERRLWLTAMRGADPLPGRPPPPEPPPLPAPPPGEASAAVALPPPRAALRHAGDVSLLARDLDRRTAERFRRGRMDIDGRIDLHGMTQAQAHGALAAFIHRAWRETRRCVLIITGKGAWSGGGVLRAAAPRWLAEPALARMILAIEPAQPKDGGDGAFYVLVRRRRDGERARSGGGGLWG